MENNLKFFHGSSAAYSISKNSKNSGTETFVMSILAAITSKNIHTFGVVVKW